MIIMNFNFLLQMYYNTKHIFTKVFTRLHNLSYLHTLFIGNFSGKTCADISVLCTKFIYLDERATVILVQISCRLEEAFIDVRINSISKCCPLFYK